MKKMILILLCVLISSLFGYAEAERVGEIPNLFTPISLSIEGDIMVIVEKDTVSIFSLKSLKKIKEISKAGEGPGEYMNFAYVAVLPGKASVSSMGKYLEFSLKGEFLTEHRHPVYWGMVQPLGKNFACQKVGFDPKKGITGMSTIIIDKNFKEKKVLDEYKFDELEKTLGGKEIENAFDHHRGFGVASDKVVIGDTSKGFYFCVFDSEGNRLYQIKKDYKPLAVTVKDRDRYIHQAEDKLRQERKNTTKYNFPDFYPAFERFALWGDKIYVFTHRHKEDFQETIVLDLKGKELKRLLLPKVDSYHRTAFCDSGFYYLVDNSETESWELFRASL